MEKEERPEDAKLTTVAVIPAAGAGVRLGADRAKQFLDLHGKPLLAVTLEKFQECPLIDSVIAVVPFDDVDYCQKKIIKRHHLTKIESVVAGGKRRQDSVRHGIEASGGRYDSVLIHDGVRPFIDCALIQRAVMASWEDRAVITALPAKETVKEIDSNGLVVKTHDRRRLVFVQTPQVFRYEDILMAHKRAVLEGWEDVTDDALLMERMGIPVKTIVGSEENIKVTTLYDLQLARFLMGK